MKKGSVINMLPSANGPLSPPADKTGVYEEIALSIISLGLGYILESR
jgi:hypothetical protein